MVLSSMFKCLFINNYGSVGFFSFLLLIVEWIVTLSFFKLFPYLSVRLIFFQFFLLFIFCYLYLLTIASYKITDLSYFCHYLYCK
jgi:hypothetical protein